ncbi:MAG: hypothetical protein ABSH19_03055 [Opitutales bacterium]|jgi:hypothetical protein
MFLRSFLCGALLVLTLSLAQLAAAAPVHKAAAPPVTQRYQGNYFLFVINPQTFFQYGGAFRMYGNGTVVGNIFDNNNNPYSITPGTTFNNQGRFAVDLVMGANITTLTIGATATGQLVGRTETPFQFYTLSGSQYNIFYPMAGVYRGTTDDGRQLVFTIGLQRRISGAFEQMSGNTSSFAAMFGGATLVGFNGRSYLAKTFFTNGTFNPSTIPGNVTGTSGPIIANGTWRNAGVVDDTGNFTVWRQNPTTPPTQPVPTD